MTLLAVVPNGYRVPILSEHHDEPEAGHRSKDHTLDMVRRQYWWPGMTADVTLFCKACILCAVTAAGGKGTGILVGWGIEPQRLMCIHADFCGPLPTTTRGHRHVFSMVDRATGWVELVATSDAKAETAARILLNHWIPRFGTPKVVITDNGRHFTAKTFAEATKKLGMRLKHSTIYHPQSNGMVERRFRDMGRSIKLFGGAVKDWDEVLPHSCWPLGTRLTRPRGLVRLCCYMGRNSGSQGTEPCLTDH